MDEPNLLAAAPITDLSQLPPRYRDTFARVVDLTLRDVFHIEENEAREKIQAYFSPTEGELNLFAFHLSPLQIAADLASANSRELTESELARYFEIQDSVFGLQGFLDEAIFAKEVVFSDNEAIDDRRDGSSGTKARSSAA